MPERHADWLRQARRDVAHAQRAAEDGDYEWSCFAAQQGAEKALSRLPAAWRYRLGALGDPSIDQPARGPSPVGRTGRARQGLG